MIPASFGILRASKPTGVRIETVSHSYQEYGFRTPLKFGGQVVESMTLIDVTCVVRDVSGKTAQGFGSMPLANAWSFPSHTLGYRRHSGRHEGALVEN